MSSCRLLPVMAPIVRWPTVRKQASWYFIRKVLAATNSLRLIPNRSQSLMNASPGCRCRSGWKAARHRMTKTKMNALR